MALSGMIGNGVKVAYSAASPVSWTRVGQVLNVDVPGLMPDEVETTVHSTSKWKRHIPGMIDVGEMNLTLLADLDEGTSPAQDALFDYQAAGTTLWWRIEIPVDRAQTEFTAIEFQGWVKNWAPKTPIEGRQELEASVRFDGDSYTKYAAGASAIS
jgi:hypothetical protein